MTCDEFQENVDAFALGALSAGEATRAAEHLASCLECVAEYLAALAVVQRLPLSVPAVRAPVGLRDRVMLAVAADGHDVTVTGLGAGERSPAAITAFPRRPNAVAPIPSSSGGEPAERSTSTPPVSVVNWRRAARGSFRVPSLAAAAVFLAVFGLAGWSFVLQRDLRDVKHTQSLARSLTPAAPSFAAASHDALVLLSSKHTVTAELDPQSTGNTGLGGVIWNADQKRCVVLARGLGPPPAGFEYRVWFRSGEKKWDGGAFTPAEDGSAEVVVDMAKWQIDDGYRITIVVQPIIDDGSRQIVLAGDVRATLQ